MTCPRCIARGQTWTGDPPACAFDESGRFISENWNCATMNDLRDIAEAGEPAWDEDTYAAVLPIHDTGTFLALCWYKRRGRTGTAAVLDDEGNGTPVTLEIAESIIWAHERWAQRHRQMGSKQ